MTDIPTRGESLPGGKGFLLVTMEPPPALEEEFNDWYDTEHVPERMAVAGFQTATRYVCTAGWPKYLAFYDLATPQTIHSPGYVNISGDRFSPWTQRMLKRVGGFYRSFGEQLHHARATSTHAGRSVLIRARGVGNTSIDQWVRGARRAFEGRDDFCELHVLRSTYGSADDVLALVDLDARHARSSIDLRGFDELASRIDLVNEYVKRSSVSTTG